MKNNFFTKNIILLITTFLLLLNTMPLQNAIFLDKNIAQPNENLQNSSNCQITNNNIITVDDDGDENYTSIQEAIDAASEGDTIQVYSGLYKENIILNKQLTLIGVEENGEGIPIIDAESGEYAVCIESDKCYFEGFNITNSSKNDIYYAGIILFSDKNIIKNNIILDNICGIWQKNSNNNIFSKNNLSNNNIGILMVESSNNIIIDNNINCTRVTMDLPYCYGIYVWYHCDNNTISNNSISCDFNGGGIMISESKNNKIINNIINSFSTLNSTSIPFKYGANAILLIQESHNTKIIANDISDYLIAIQIWNSNKNLLSKNNIVNNGLYGLYLYISHFNNIKNNNFIDNSKLWDEELNRIPDGLFKWFFMRLVKQQATFADSFFNNWNRNYWDDWSKILTKSIRGFISIRKMTKIIIDDKQHGIPHIPVRKYDWFPLKEPYENNQEGTSFLTFSNEPKSNNLFNLINNLNNNYNQKVNLPKINIFDEKTRSKTNFYLPPFNLTPFLGENL